MFKWEQVLLLIELWCYQKTYFNEPLLPIRIRTNNIRKNRHFLIDNKQCLCDHGGFRPMMARKAKYIAGNVYNQIN